MTSNSPNPSMVLSDVYQSGSSINISDRILVKVRATNTSNQSHTITFVTEGNVHYSYGQTTLGVVNGTSGTSGASGSSGTSGLSGATGSSGTSGTSGTSPIIYKSATTLSITGFTETIYGTFAIPTNISSGMIRCTFVNENTVAGTPSGGGVSRIRIGAVQNPDYSQLNAMTILAINTVTATTSINIFRNFPVIGGSSGSINCISRTSNIISDQSTAAAYSLVSNNFTTQTYLHFTIVGNSATSVCQSYLAIVEIF